MSDKGHVWNTSAHVSQSCPLFFFFLSLLDTGGTLIFYFFLVSIVNAYLVIFYLLF